MPLLYYKSHHQDVIEEDPEPHSHPEPKPGDDAIRISKRVRIFDSDLKDFGYTENYPRCTFVRCGQPLRARGTRHSEECRASLYDAMREAGTEKLKRADLEDEHRTRIQPEKIPRSVKRSLRMFQLLTHQWNILMTQ